MMMKKTLLLTSLVLLTTGCAPAILGSGAYVAKSVTSERGLGGTFSDIDIQAGINKRWWNHDADMNKRYDLTVTEGRVLITGQARDQQQKLDASRLAWETPGVKEVLNEASVDGSTTIGSFSRDLWITTKLRTFLTVDMDVAGRNYTIDTVKGVVYLMGYARSQEELNRVTNQASNIGGVERVVSYVRVGDQMAPAPSSSGPIEAQPIYNPNVQ
jgi:osmotically-inducible protein OsmY